MLSLPKLDVLGPQSGMVVCVCVCVGGEHFF